jgi:hypothetical protein
MSSLSGLPIGCKVSLRCAVAADMMLLSMHCRTCGYALWNLSEPRCPECGTAFDLRHYRFVPGTVGFACPHCGHLHGGMGPQHLPALTEQAVCGGCGRTMEVARMRVVLMADDPALAQAEADVLPWEHRKRLGFWRAWWRTWGLSLGHTAVIGRQINPEGSFWEAYWFAAFSIALTAVPCAVAMALLMLVGKISQSGSQTAPTFHLGQFTEIGTVVLTMTFAAMVVPLAMCLYTALPAHLLLILTGPHRAGLSLTARSVLYSAGPMAFLPVAAMMCCCCLPLGLVLPLWPMIGGMFILQHAQQVAMGRAILACIWFPLLALFLGGTAAIIAAIIQA